MRRAEDLANIVIELESAMNECRSQIRVLDVELIMLWKENSPGCKQLGNVEDLSPDGISVIVEHSVSIGTSVKVSYGEGDLTGVVMHCAPSADGYLMGIEFVGDSKDSVLHFQPELLIR